jgi:hypothetical protein
MNKISILFFLLLISTSLVSQNTGTEKKKTNFRKQLHASTKEQIDQLKNGALLVRLKTKTTTINALRKAGANARAEEIQRQQTEFNLNVIAAFRKNFNFCPIYFFYSDDSDNIRKKQFDQVTFLNDSLHADQAIKFNGKEFLTADFGTVEQDTAKYFSHNSYEPDGNFSVKKEDHYNGGPSFSYEGLIIRNDKFIQLRHPFPYFVRTRDSRPNKKKLNRTVKTMNKKLTNFYQENH